MTTAPNVTSKQTKNEVKMGNIASPTPSSSSLSSSLLWFVLSPDVSEIKGNDIIRSIDGSVSGVVGGASPAACRSAPGCCSGSPSPCLRWSRTGSRRGSSSPSSRVPHLNKNSRQFLWKRTPPSWRWVVFSPIGVSGSYGGSGRDATLRLSAGGGASVCPF